jgi:hypothetical protein
MDRYVARPRVALGSLMFFHVGFWLGFELLRQSVLAVVGDPSLMMLELSVVLLVPLASSCWAFLERHGLQPSTAAKFSLGFVLLAMSWFCLGVGAEWSGRPGAVSIVACVSLLSLAALCLAPASARAIAELGGGEHRRAWWGVWLLGYLFARGAGSWGGASMLAGTELVEHCVSVGLGCVVAGVGMAFVWRPITSLADACGREASSSTRRTGRVRAAMSSAAVRA